MAAACKTLLGSTTLVVLFGFCLQVYFLTSQEVYNRSKHNNSQRLEEGGKRYTSLNPIGRMKTFLEFPMDFLSYLTGQNYITCTFLK